MATFYGADDDDEGTSAASLIEQLTKKRADLRVEYAAQKKVLLELEAQLNATEERLSKQLASISAIHRLPSDVLCMIFLTTYIRLPHRDTLALGLARISFTHLILALDSYAITIHTLYLLLIFTSHVSLLPVFLCIDQ